MDIALRGSSPGATTAGILLLTRARQLGFRLAVSIVGDVTDLTTVLGPTVVHAPVIASCGIGRELGVGGTVVVPGPPDEAVLVSLASGGADGWFEVDRSGRGTHPATQAMVRLANDARVDARHLAKEVRRAMSVLGSAAEPAVLDVLFGAPVPPLTRLAVALRMGRSMGPGRGEPITRFLSGLELNAEPLADRYDRTHLEDLLRYGSLQWILDGLDPPIRARAHEWLERARTVAGADGGRDFALLYGLAVIVSHLVQLPPNSLLPPLDAAEDGVALCLGAALTATGTGDANAELARVFQFLGGRYVDHAPHVVELDDAPAPAGRVERWRWFCRQAMVGRDRSLELWPRILDPPH